MTEKLKKLEEEKSKIKEKLNEIEFLINSIQKNEEIHFDNIKVKCSSDKCTNIFM